jgi:CRP-like cAMP-binding protein
LIEEEGNGLQNMRETPKQMLHMTNCFSKTFTGFDALDIEMMAENSFFVRVPNGRHILKRGETPHFIAVIVQGTAEVSFEGSDHVTPLNAGEVLGEMSLFQGGARLADVVSTSHETVVAAIPFEDLVEKHHNPATPELCLKLLNMCIRAALRKLHSTVVRALPREKFESLQNPPPEYIRDKLMEAHESAATNMFSLARSKGFAEDLSEQDAMFVAERAILKEFKRGEMIIKEGTLGTSLLFILDGDAEVKATDLVVDRKSKGVRS